MKEGLHEGGARNKDNVLLPKTYELNNWKTESGRSHTSTGSMSFKEGQDVLNNTAALIALPVKAASNPVINTAVKTAVKTAIKEGMKSLEK